MRALGHRALDLDDAERAQADARAVAEACRQALISRSARTRRAKPTGAARVARHVRLLAAVDPEAERATGRKGMAMPVHS